MLRTLIISLMLVVTTAFAGVRADVDANADHNILTPTAETINQGELTFNSYELFFAGVSYGVTNEFQLTFTTLLPIVSEIPFVGLLTGKYRLMDNGNTAFAIQPGVMFLTSDGDTIGTLNLTFMFDFMLNENNIITLSSSSNMPFADSDLFEGFSTTFTAAINSRVSEHVKLVAELTIIGGYANGNFEILDEFLLFNYGVRFFNKDLAAMLSFIKPIVSGGEDVLLMGWPYVTFTAKF